MPIRIFILVAAVSLTASLAEAEELKCSAQAAVAPVQEDLSAASTMNAVAMIYGASLDDETRFAIERLRYLGAEPVFGISEYIGIPQGDTIRQCSAKMSMSAPGRQGVTAQIAYKLAKTEDGMIVVTENNFLTAEIELVIAFDRLNEVYDIIDGDKNAQTQKFLTGDSAETVKKYSEAHPDMNKPMPSSTGQGSDFERVKPSQSNR